jgi:Ca2+-binding EF-hand superfamily protein
VIVAGNVEPDFYLETVLHALAVEGVKNCVHARIPDLGSLPYAVQRLGKQADVVVAGGIVSASQAETAANLSQALLQAGLQSHPTIPAFITRSSLLESKALLPAEAKEWAQSAATVLSLSNVEVVAAAPVEIKEVPVLTPQLSSVDDLLEILRASLKAHGATGMIGLARKFRIIDDDNSNSIDLQEFTKAISEHALGWTAAQIKAVFEKFDKDRSGKISLNEFVEGVRGQLNDRRKQIVLQAFQVLDSDKSGVIEMNDILEKYDASKHPDVLAGKLTNEQVLRYEEKNTLHI